MQSAECHCMCVRQLAVDTHLQKIAVSVVWYDLMAWQDARMDPTRLFDKSFRQSLNVDEAIILDQLFTCVFILKPSRSASIVLMKDRLRRVGCNWRTRSKSEPARSHEWRARKLFRKLITPRVRSPAQPACCGDWLRTKPAQDRDQRSRL